MNTKGKVPEDGYVALIDPDFVFMKPLTRKVAGEDILYGDKVRKPGSWTGLVATGGSAWRRRDSADRGKGGVSFHALTG